MASFAVPLILSVVEPIVALLCVELPPDNVQSVEGFLSQQGNKEHHPITRFKIRSRKSNERIAGSDPLMMDLTLKRAMRLGESSLRAKRSNPMSQIKLDCFVAVVRRGVELLALTGRTYF
jgi:hypothetical protein